MIELEDVVIELEKYFSRTLCKWGFVSFEKNGLCQIQAVECKYCEQHGDEYFCNKKTYTLISKPVCNFV